MQTITLVITSPTQPINLGCSVAGGSVIAASEGDCMAEQQEGRNVAIAELIRRLNELRWLPATAVYYLDALNAKLESVMGFLAGIFFSGITTPEQHKRLHALAFSAWERRFSELGPVPLSKFIG